MEKAVIAFLFLGALQQAHSVPSTLQTSCSPELIRLKQGDALYLPCGSHCSGSTGDHSYTWWKISERDGRKQQLSNTGAAIIDDGVTGENGGEYECKCGSHGQICTFYVGILPEVTFTSSHTGTHYGSTVTLTCAMEGYPANTTVITNSFGIRVPTQFKKKINHYWMETIAVIQNIEEEEYVCIVETNYKGYSVAEEKQSLKINLYNPPSIMYTTEYVIHRESDFGKPGQLSCAVQTSRDTQSHVTWWADGVELKDGGNYRMSSSFMSDEVKVFQLHMDTVQQSDIGSYLCRLSSDYNVEESQEAWIKVDYRNEARRIGGSLYTHNTAGGDSHPNSLHKATSSLHRLAVLLCLVVVAGLGTWGVVIHRRKWKRSSDMDGIIGRGRGLSSPARSPLLQSSMGSGLAVFRRK